MRYTIVLLSLFASACGGHQLADNMRQALPDSSRVQLGTAKDHVAGTGTSNFASREDYSSVGDDSTFYDTTYRLARGVNGGMIWVLTIVKGVAHTPPTTCTGDTCTWGPGSDALDPNIFKLVISRRETPVLHYEYILAGEPKSKPASGFITVISGTAYPSGRPNRGNGEFMVDFDAAQKLDRPDGNMGVLTAKYDNTNDGQAKLEVRCVGCRDEKATGQKTNAAYAYAQVDGGGDLQLAWKNTTSNDQLSIHSRWNKDGVGRGDISAATAAYSATASECWSAAPFKVTYFASSDPTNPDLGPNDGVESSCAFQPATFATLTVP